MYFPEGLLKVVFDTYFKGHYTLPASVQEMLCVANITFTHPTTLHHLLLGYGGQVDLSHVRIHKLAIIHEDVKIKAWPQDLKELAFTVDHIFSRLQVPEGCKVVGEKRPRRVLE